SHELVVVGPRFTVPGIALRIHQLELLARFDTQAEFLQPHFHHLWAPDQDRLGELLVHHYLHRTQHALVFALCVDHPSWRLLGLGEYGLHDQTRVIHEVAELLAVGFEVGERPSRHAAFHRGFRYGRGDPGNEARIEGLGDNVLRSEADLFTFVGHRDDIRLLGLGQFSDGLHARELHLVGDTRGAHVQGTAEDEWETQHVVDLVRIVRAAGGDDAVGPHRLCELGTDFRLRVREREDKRLVGHFL